MASARAVPTGVDTHMEREVRISIGMDHKVDINCDLVFSSRARSYHTGCTWLCENYRPFSKQYPKIRS